MDKTDFVKSLLSSAEKAEAAQIALIRKGIGIATFNSEKPLLYAFFDLLAIKDKILDRHSFSSDIYKQLLVSAEEEIRGKMEKPGWALTLLPIVLHRKNFYRHDSITREASLTEKALEFADKVCAGVLHKGVKGVAMNLEITYRYSLEQQTYFFRTVVTVKVDNAIVGLKYENLLHSTVIHK